MNMNSLIITTLAPTGVPVSFLTYAGKVFPYITFFEVIDQGEMWADNVETHTGHYMQIDIWSKGSYLALVDTVTTLMLAAGFTRSNGQDLYESDTQTFHKPLRFYYPEEL